MSKNDLNSGPSIVVNSEFLENSKNIVNGEAVALWLIENTGLTFEQIAKFCGLHMVKLKAISLGEVNVRPCNPLATNQLTKEEIERCTKDPTLEMQSAPDPRIAAGIKPPKAAKYKHVAYRSLIPEAILWLVTHYPDLTDAQIVKLIGTTKSTVQKIRNNSYKKMNSLTPKDPVLVGFCTRRNLDEMISKLPVLDS